MSIDVEQPDEVRLSGRYVVGCVDLLGFTAASDDQGSTAIELARTQQRMVEDIHNVALVWGIQTYWGPDDYWIAVPVVKDQQLPGREGCGPVGEIMGIAVVSWLLARMQLRMLVHGQLFRGAIGVGPIEACTIPEVAKSSTVQRVADLEKSVAKFPRIVIDPPIGDRGVRDPNGVIRLDQVPPQFCRLAAHAESGTWHVDVFEYLEGPPERKLDALSLIFDQLLDGLMSAPTESGKEKWTWMLKECRRTQANL